MKRMISTRCLVFVWLMLQAGLLAGQSDDEPVDHRSIIFPDIPGYHTLCCDFHMHTVFSDGNVWPSLRVQEAIRNGLDAISITDHLEYQPHQTDILNPDRNRPYQLALELARGTDLMIIPGVEITRSMPTGHFNAIFIEDANELNQPDGVAALSDMHRELLEEDLFGGIEVVNETSYSDEALEIAEQNKLTLQVKTLKEMDTFELSFTVLNAFTSPGTHPEISLLISDSAADSGLSYTNTPAP